MFLLLFISRKLLDKKQKNVLLGGIFKRFGSRIILAQCSSAMVFNQVPQIITHIVPLAIIIQSTSGLFFHILVQPNKETTQ
jgi:hypothetical protein